MPSINDSRQTVEADIPSIPESKVVLWDNLTVGDMEKVHASKDNNVAMMIIALGVLIKEWNLEEPVSDGNIRKLQISDLDYLLSKTKFYADAKKKAEELEDEQFEKKTNS